MFKLYKNAFKMTNDGIILTIPLALFWWLLTMYTEFSKAVVDTYPEVILSIITMLFMTSAFCAGWFYMVKKCVQFSKKNFIFDKDKDNESIRLFKAIPNGIGRYFLYYVEVSLLFIAIAMLMIFTIKYFSSPYIAQINEILVKANINATSPQEMHTYLDTLNSDKVLTLFNALLIPSLKLLSIVISIPTIASFLMLLWMPEIIYTKKNPIIALFTSIKKVMIKFWKSLKLYIYIAFVQMVISALGPLSLLNPIYYMLTVIIYFYFLVYVVVLIFSYYDSEFCKKQ